MTTPEIAGVALAVAVLLTPVLIRVAVRSGIVDRPGELKDQTVPVPYLGGVAVFAGTAVGVLASRPTLLVPLAAALVLGVADDRFDLSAPVRLSGEVLIGVAVAVTCPVRFTGWVAVVLVVAVTLVTINGVNLLDGLDMLAGGVAAVAAVAFAVLLNGTGRAVAVALAGALVGFLVFNRPPARIYLGDGGSYLIGAALAVLTAHAWAPDRTTRFGVAALALVAVPTAEVACAVVRRLRGRRSLMAGDRGHPYDRLVALGWSRPSASLAYIGVEIVLAVLAVLVAHHAALPSAIAFDLGVGVVLVTLAGWAGGLAPDVVSRT